jgi:hypothetical protein
LTVNGAQTLRAARGCRQSGSAERPRAAITRCGTVRGDRGRIEFDQTQPSIPRLDIEAQASNGTDVTIDITIALAAITFSVPGLPEEEILAQLLLRQRRDGALSNLARRRHFRAAAANHICY